MGRQRRPLRAEAPRQGRAYERLQLRSGWQEVLRVDTTGATPPNRPDAPRRPATGSSRPAHPLGFSMFLVGQQGPCSSRSTSAHDPPLLKLFQVSRVLQASWPMCLIPLPTHTLCFRHTGHPVWTPMNSPQDLCPGCSLSLLSLPSFFSSTFRTLLPRSTPWLS